MNFISDPGLVVDLDAVDSVLDCGVRCRLDQAGALGVVALPNAGMDPAADVFLGGLASSSGGAEPRLGETLCGSLILVPALLGQFQRRFLSKVDL